jgi:hypothetical protein
MRQLQCLRKMKAAGRNKKKCTKNRELKNYDEC